MSRVRMLAVVVWVVAGAAVCFPTCTRAVTLHRDVLSLGIPDQEGEGGSFHRRIAMSSDQPHRAAAPETAQIEREPTKSPIDWFKAALRLLRQVRSVR